MPFAGTNTTYDDPSQVGLVQKGSQDRRLWIFDAGLRKLNFWMFICFLSSYAIGYDGSLFSGLLTLKVWYADMGSPDGQMIGVIGMSGAIGLVFSPIIGSWACDRYGRRQAFIWSSFLCVVFGALTSVKITPPHSQLLLFIFMKIGLSAAVGAAVVAAPTLISETAHPDQRAIIVAIYLCGFYLGAIVAGWTTFATNSWTSSWSWRFPMLFQIAPSAVQFVLIWWCPESPRWLISKGRHEEARQFFVKYHANGDENSLFIKQEIAEITTALDAESKQGTASWLEFVKTPANRHRTWICISLGIASQWVGNGVVAYYLPTILASVGVTNTAEQAKFNGGLAIFNLFISAFAASFCEKIGRRPLFLTAGIGMLISFIIITALSATYANDPNTALGKGVIAFLFIFYGFYDIGITPFQFSYPIECMPFRLRSKGVAITLVTQGTAVMFNIFVNPIALAAIQWRFYLVYVAVLVGFVLNVYFLFPETKGRTLEQVEVIFEGEKKDLLSKMENGPTVAQLPKNDEVRHTESYSSETEKKGDVA